MKNKIFFLLFLLPFLSGCTLVDTINQKAKETLKKQQEEAFNIKIGKEVDMVQEVADKLTAEDKAKIEAWLKENKLNAYGDPFDRMYAGGTPLFDEATGKTTDRYYYILQKNPTLIENLKLKK